MINEHLVQEWIQTAKGLETPSPCIPDEKLAVLSLSVVLEEVFEQAEACGPEILLKFAELCEKSAQKHRQMVESGAPLNTGITALRDAISDTLVTAFNMPTYAGLIETCQSDYEEVMRSNFTKFCTNENDAKVSIDKYKKDGREVIYKKHGKYFVLFDATTGKILKGIHYEEPKLW